MRYLTHSFTNTATNEICVSAVAGFNCPAFVRPQLAAYLGAFNTNDVCQNYLGDSGPSGGGTQAPVCSFRVPAGSNFVLVVSTRSNQGCVDYTAQLFGLPCPPPTIAINAVAGAAAAAGQAQSLDTHIEINWTTASPGWTAQQAGRVGGTFSDVSSPPILMNGRYTLGNIPLTTNQFYRLKKD